MGTATMAKKILLQLNGLLILTVCEIFSICFCSNDTINKTFYDIIYDIFIMFKKFKT